MFLLARELGMTVHQLGSSMGMVELNHWMAVHYLDPLGEERADLRAGYIASSIRNAHRAKGGKVWSPKDFSFVRQAPKKFDPQKLKKGFLDFIARKKAQKQQG